MTPACVFGSPPTVSGTSSAQQAEGRVRGGVGPFPAIGRVMFATVPASLTSTVIGANARPLASARRFSSSIALCIAGVRTLGASATTFAGSAEPGNACCIRSYVLMTSSPFGNDSGPSAARRSCSAGASASKKAAASPAESAGRRRTRSTIAPQMRPSPSSRRRRETSGTRPLSTLSPSRESSAGSTVSDPSTATATTRIVASASDGRIAGQEHACHRDHHGQAGDEHGAPGGGGGDLERRLRAAAAARSCRSRFK